METGMNTLQNRYKIYNFTLLSSIAAMVYAVWDDRGRRLAAERIIEMVARNFRRKSSKVCLFSFC